MIAAALVVSGSVGLVIATGTTAVAHADSGPAWSVPLVPTQQPALAMNCAPGQVDLNHASLADLQTLPDVSAPIAQRIVDMRPHDRTQDLLVVPGVGPDKLAEIKATGRTCSTPLTLPPPAADVCTAWGQLDVNNPASQSGLAALFGAPTAQRIVAAEPFPDLAHAKVVLAAGAGPGKVTKYASRLCATPEPKTTGGVNYSYVYSARGGRADLGSYGLVVPAGALTAPVGQWLRITPSTPPSGGVAWPSAEFSVLGAAWSDGVKHVYVTMPQDTAPLPDTPGGYEQSVLHWNDANRTSGELIPASQLIVDATRGTVTAAVTHLSTMDTVKRGVQWTIEMLMNVAADARFPAPSCDVAYGLDSDTGDWTDQDLSKVHLTSAFLNLPGNPIPLMGWPLKHCVEGRDGSTDAFLRLRNNTRTMMDLTSFSGSPALGNVNIGGDYLQLLFAGLMQDLYGHPVAYPGGDVTVGVPRASAATVQMKPNGVETAVWAALDQSPVKDWLDKLTTFTPARSLVTGNLSCVMNTPGVVGLLKDLGSSSVAEIGETVGGAVRDCISPQAFWDVMAKAVKAGVISGPAANAVSSAVDAIDRYSVVIRASQLAISGADWLLNAQLVGSSAGIIGVEHYAPEPVNDPDGNLFGPGCVTPNGHYGWTVNQACQAAWLASLSPGGANSCSSTLQCQPAGSLQGGDTTGGTSTSTSCNPFPEQGSVQPAADGCILWQSPSSYTWCGIGECIPFTNGQAPEVISLTDSRAFLLDSNGGYWYLPTTDAYWSCANKYTVLKNPYQADGKWYSDNLATWKYRGSINGCS